MSIVAPITPSVGAADLSPHLIFGIFMLQHKYAGMLPCLLPQFACAWIIAALQNVIEAFIDQVGNGLAFFERNRAQFIVNQAREIYARSKVRIFDLGQFGQAVAFHGDLPPPLRFQRRFVRLRRVFADGWGRGDQKTVDIEDRRALLFGAHGD